MSIFDKNGQPIFKSRQQYVDLINIIWARGHHLIKIDKADSEYKAYIKQKTYQWHDYLRVLASSHPNYYMDIAKNEPTSVCWITDIDTSSDPPFI